MQKFQAGEMKIEGWVNVFFKTEFVGVDCNYAQLQYKQRKTNKHRTEQLLVAGYTSFHSVRLY